MGRFNEGIVHTNSKCVGCNKCISVCPSLGANVSVADNGKTKVAVSRKCINCGLCIDACIHKARDYRDDFEIFLEDLKNGERISILIDPSFYADYGERAGEILGVLKKLGVYKFYDVAYGAEISIFNHVKYLKEHIDKRHQSKQFISNTCAAVVSYVEKLHPNFLPLLIPVQSPCVSTAIYVHKYLKDDSKLAYLNSCVTVAQEIKNADTKEEIEYSFTFSSLAKFIRKENLSAESAEADLRCTGIGNIVPYMHGFIDAVSLYFDKGEVFTHFSGIDESTTKMLNAIALSNTVAHPLMLSISACKEGCLMGSGVRRRDVEAVGIMEEYRKIRNEAFKELENYDNPEKYYEAQKEKYKDLDFEDFKCEFHDNFKQPYVVPEDAIDEIFKSMHKDTKSKQTVNCQSCGYKSCRELAVAVANGYARIQDCVHFMNDDLQFSARIDRMTGIPNQKGFRVLAREILDKNPDKEYVVYVGNVNKLKNVNDLYGIDMGDKVLCYIARRISEMAEDFKGTCGRFSGGTFAIFFENTQKNNECFRQYEVVNVRRLGVYFPVTIRYGFYIFNDHKLRLEDVSNLCTYAADTVKNRTKNTYTEFTDEMRAEMQNETDITLKMRDAMDNDEFVLYLQPQYNHNTGKIVGAEALCRWVKPDGKIVSPGLFIPVFEKNGFIKDLDKYVWEEAFKLVQKWEKEKTPMVPISVNISRVSLETDEIIDVIEKFSKIYPIDKKNLYFEITESAYMKDQLKLTERICHLKSIGFDIAMDDFGSGYSSLNSLKDIPLDVLKLDMGFLRGGTNIERGNEIISHVVDMAKALELKTVAEGVETKEQADFLTNKGCDVIQGYYYAKPMPLSDYCEKLKTDL